MVFLYYLKYFYLLNSRKFLWTGFLFPWPISPTSTPIPCASPPSLSPVYARTWSQPSVAHMAIATQTHLATTADMWVSPVHYSSSPSWTQARLHHCATHGLSRSPTTLGYLKPRCACQNNCLRLRLQSPKAKGPRLPLFHWIWIFNPSAATSDPLSSLSTPPGSPCRVLPGVHLLVAEESPYCYSTVEPASLPCFAVATGDHWVPRMTREHYLSPRNPTCVSKTSPEALYCCLAIDPNHRHRLPHLRPPCRPIQSHLSH